MIWTVIVYFVAELLYRNAVLASLVWFMHAFTFCFELWKIMLKAFMLHLRHVILLCTISALFVRTMVTLVLNILQLLFGQTQTIYALPLGPMEAMGLFYFLISEWFVLWGMLWRACLICSGIDHCSSRPLFFNFFCNCWLSASHAGCCKLCVLVFDVNHVSVPEILSFNGSYFSFKPVIVSWSLPTSFLEYLSSR